MKKENYKELYAALPQKAQKAIRDLLQVISETDRRHPVISNTVCTSRFDDAIGKVNRATREIRNENQRPEVCEFSGTPYVYYEERTRPTFTP